MNHLLCSLIILSLVSCGKKDSQKSDMVAEEQVETPAPLALDGSNIQGTYLATFQTLNPQINGTIPGSTTFYRHEDKLFIYLRLFAGAPKAWHQQKIYLGTRCPTLKDDLNGDGWIDIVEAEAVLGQIIVPLDANISSQDAGRNFYPVGDLGGSYHYERITSFKRFFEDLKKEDKRLDDNVAKLKPDEGLEIEGRTVLIQGVAEDADIPPSVESQGRQRPYQSLPIACGVFKKVKEFPGRLDDGIIPGPVDPEPGIDRPAIPNEETPPMPEVPTSPNTTNDADENDTTFDDDD